MEDMFTLDRDTYPDDLMKFLRRAFCEAEDLEDPAKVAALEDNESISIQNELSSIQMALEAIKQAAYSIRTDENLEEVIQDPATTTNDRNIAILRKGQQDVFISVARAIKLDWEKIQTSRQLRGGKEF